MLSSLLNLVELELVVEHRQAVGAVHQFSSHLTVLAIHKICGRVTGYQHATPDGFAGPGWSGHNDLNSYYIDGVSNTRGSPRQHVWTFGAGYSRNTLIHPQYTCPCASGSTQSTQSFVGSNYFCESGNHLSAGAGILFTSDPLWDGQNCGSIESNCCSAAGIPWFHRSYSVATKDYIELRVCGDQSTGDEDTPVSYYEIYVKQKSKNMIDNSAVLAIVKHC